MKKYLALLLLLTSALTLKAQTAFFTEDFETDGLNTRYTAPDGNGSDGDEDYFDRISNDTSDRTHTNVQGTFYWGAQDIDDGAAAGVKPASLLITGIDITGRSGLQFSAYFAEQRPEAGGADDIDAGDFAIIEYQIDNGGYQNLIAFEGGGGNNTPFFEDTDFDGTGDGTQLETAFAQFTKSIAGTGDSLDLRFTVSVNFGDEDIAFDNIQVLELVSSEEAITLSASPTTVDEGSTLTVTLSVPTSVSTDSVFNLTSGGDGSELNIPATATILSGTSSADFDVSGLSDGEFDGDQDVTITAELAGYISDSLDITVVDAESATPSGDLIISQYYEGTSYNKYIEVTNIGDNPIDLTGYTIVRWNDVMAEEYKTAESLPAGDDENYADSLDLSSLGTIQPDQTMVFAHSGADSPLAGSSADLSGDYTSPFGFNGNDSIVIYNSATPNPANIVDAIGFTNSGEEGKDRSFVRAGAFQGYDLIAGSNASSSQFGTVWTEITNATADAASYGADGFIGTTALAIAPTAINFTDLAIMVTEDGVSADLTVEISNPDGANSVSVDVVFNSGSSTADTTDISDYTTQTLTFPLTAVTGEQQTVTVTITDDSELEGIEEAIFDLSNLVTSNTNAKIGGADTATLTIQDNDAVIPDLIISEVADPNGTAGTNARYVELYNPTDSTINLAAGNWSLVRYLGTASATKQSVSLTGSIPAGGTYVVARNESVFTSTYSQSPDQSDGDISGDGDDAYALFFGGNNITGTLVDLYGDIGDGSGGIDGTGETWEYEDGRAVRNSDITSPNATFNAAEWTIYNDSPSTTGSNGIAEVADMTPGVHPDPSAADPVADYLTGRVLTSDDLGTDINGNGFTVLEEYLAGFGDSSGSDVISYGIDNGATLALTLTSDLELEPVGIGVVLEATSDLGVAFAPVAFSISVVNNDGSFTRSYTETSPPASEQRFLRLNITEE